MCLAVLSVPSSQTEPLLVVMNRDEHFSRPTQPLHAWPNTDIFAAQDLRAGGTWIGCNRRAAFALLTNFRVPEPLPETVRPSRGLLVRDFLDGQSSPEEFFAGRREHLASYAPFNLILGTRESCFHISNVGRPELRRLEPGVHAISNGPWDRAWPKMQTAAKAMQSFLSAGPTAHRDPLQLLNSTDVAADHLLPKTGLSLAGERRHSACFIRPHAGYGTRTTSYVELQSSGKVVMRELSHEPANAGRVCALES